MHAMTLHAQADLWQHRAATFAALFMEGEIQSPDNEVDRTDVLLYAVMNRGLPLATDLLQLALSPRPGWAIRLNTAGALTLTWPHVQPLLLDAPLPALATHDDASGESAGAAATEAGVPKDQYELQMLYGLRPKRWRELVAHGHIVRVYMPYGTHWFPYYSRRIRERKENLMFVVKNLFGG